MIAERRVWVVVLLRGGLLTREHAAELLHVSDSDLVAIEREVDAAAHLALFGRKRPARRET